MTNAELLEPRLLPPRKEKWVVHVQHAGDGRKVLDYLARYVHRVALTNRSIVAADDRAVTVRYVHTRTRERRLLTLEPVDFVARFLQRTLQLTLQRAPGARAGAPPARGG